MAQYKVGTVTVTLNDGTITGDGTSWLTEVAAGDWFSLQGVDQGIYEVLSVTSNTELEIIGTYGGVNAAAQTYWVFSGFTSPDNIPIISEGDVDTHRIMARFAVKTQELFNQTVTAGVGALKDLSDVDSTLAPNNNDVLKYNSTSAKFESTVPGNAPIDNLTDVTITSAVAGEILQLSAGALWVNQTLAEAGVSAVGHAHTESDISDLQAYLLNITGESIGSLADVNTGGKTNNDLLQYNSTSGDWEPVNLTEANIATATHTHVLDDLTDVSQSTNVTVGGSNSLVLDSGTWKTQKNNIATTDPTTNHSVGSGYAVGSRWFNLITDEEFVMVHGTGASDAVWKITTESDFYSQSTVDAKVAVNASVLSVHQTDLTIHRVINDAGTLTTELFSASKIISGLGTKSNTGHTHTESDITDLQSYSLTTHNHTLDSLSNVVVTTIADGQALTWNATASNWENADIPTDHTALTNIGTKTHVQIDSHIADLTVHRVINDAGTLTTELFSASKIISGLGTKSDTGHAHVEADITDLDKYTQAIVDAKVAVNASNLNVHEVDLTTHRIINDISILTTELFSASKIISELGTKSDTGHAHVEADITDLDKYTQAIVDAKVAVNASSIAVNASVLSVHQADLTVHRVINDAGTLTTELFSASKIISELGTKSDTGHLHTESDITDLQSYLLNITGESIKSLSDVFTAMTPTDGQVLTYDTTNGWQSEGVAFTITEQSKLAGIETAADVTDTTNVASAGAVMESDTSTTLMSFVIDEDNMITNSATKVPTQQSVKAYIDTEVAAGVSSEMSFKGDYNASTNIPNLDAASPVATAVGDMYVVTVAGTFFTIAVEAGDTLIAEKVGSTLEADWTIVNRNLDDASIKVAYENNSNTNAFTDAEQSKLTGIETAATADQTAGEIEAIVDHDLLVGFVVGEHRIINDAGTLTNELFSASKIISGLGTKSDTGHAHVEADITDLDKYTQATVDAKVAVNASVLSVHQADLTIHRVINDAGTLTTELFSASKIISGLGTKSDTGHAHTESDITDLDKYTQAIVDAKVAVNASNLNVHENAGINTHSTIDSHLASTSNPHSVSKAQVLSGDLIVNADVDANAKIDTDKLWMPVIGTPAYSSLEEYLNIIGSVGVLTGGVITEGTALSANVSEVTVALRATDSETATLKMITVPAVTGLALTLNETNHIYVEYNAGSPRIVVSITDLTDHNTNVELGHLYKDSAELHINDYSGNHLASTAHHIEERLIELEPFARVSGGVTSEVGTRNIAVTAGSWWEGLQDFTTDALDTSIAGTFVYWYRDGAGAWTNGGAATQISNTLYDDNSGTLATLGNSKYGVFWVFITTDSEVDVLYGQESYSLTDAQDATVPSALPPHFPSHARIIAKIIIGKNDVAFTQLDVAFSVSFSPSIATDHGDLIGLSDDDHTQYHTDARGDARYYTQTIADATFSVVAHDHALTDLSDATIVTPLNDQVLAYNSTSGEWENQTPVTGVTDHTLLSNVGTNTHVQIDSHIADGTIHYTVGSISITESQISDLQTYSTTAHTHGINDLTDVALTAVADGELLQYNASALNFVNRTLAEAGIADAAHNHSGVYEPIDANILRQSDIGTDIQAYDTSINTFTNNYAATVAPTTTNDSSEGYSVGSSWIDVTANKTYTCVDSTIAAAIWAIPATTVDGLSDTNFGALFNFDILSYDGTNWIERTRTELGLMQGNNNLSELTTPSTARSNLGLVIGTDVQSYDINTRTIKDNFLGTLTPTVNDDITFGYTIGSMWAKPNPSDRLWICLANTNGAAIWTEIDTPVRFSNIDDLSDVSAYTHTKGKLLVSNGAAWSTLTAGALNSVLIADSSEATGLKWGLVPATTLGYLTDTNITAVAKGDTLVYNGTYWVDLTVGVNGQKLTADSTEPTGMKWTTDTASANWLYANNGADWITDPIATGVRSFAIGETATTGAVTDSLALGDVVVSQNNAVGIGDNITSDSLEGVVIGYNSDSTTGAGQYVFGRESHATAANALIFGNSLSNSIASSLLMGISTTNAMHLKDTGTLTLLGAKAQFVQPNYITASLPVGVEGGTVWDTTTNELKVYNGSSWIALGTATSTIDGGSF